MKQFLALLLPLSVLLSAHANPGEPPKTTPGKTRQIPTEAVKSEAAKEEKAHLDELQTKAINDLNKRVAELEARVKELEAKKK